MPIMVNDFHIVRIQASVKDYLEQGIIIVVIERKTML